MRPIFRRRHLLWRSPRSRLHAPVWGGISLRPLSVARAGLGPGPGTVSGHGAGLGPCLCRGIKHADRDPYPAVFVTDGSRLGLCPFRGRRAPRPRALSRPRGSTTCHARAPGLHGGHTSGLRTSSTTGLSCAARLRSAAPRPAARSSFSDAGSAASSSRVAPRPTSPTRALRSVSSCPLACGGPTSPLPRGPIQSLARPQARPLQP